MSNNGTWSVSFHYWIFKTKICECFWTKNDKAIIEFFNVWTSTFMNFRNFTLKLCKFICKWLSVTFKQSPRHFPQVNFLTRMNFRMTTSLTSQKWFRERVHSSCLTFIKTLFCFKKRIELVGSRSSQIKS